MKILIFGNGHAEFSDSGKILFDHEEVEFIKKLSYNGFNIIWAMPLISGKDKIGLNGTPIDKIFVKYLNLDKFSILSMWTVFCEVLMADFVYLFFPGSWPRFFGKMRRYLGKPYGIYVRGEKFGSSKGDLSLFTQASFICSVVGLEKRIIQYNNDIYNIKPMLRLDETEGKKKHLQEISSRPLRILFVGRIEEAKGIPELIEASRIMNDLGLSYNMRLVGVGSLYDNVNDQLKYQNTPNISLIGLVTNKKDMVEQYEWADVLVLPSHHEGFPRVILEAMLKSCVVVTTMVGGIPTVMNDGSNCLSIPLRDATAIANTLGNLPSDLEKMQEIADAGRETVLDILRTRQSHADTLCEALESRYL